jgi:hypothetical protein
MEAVTSPQLTYFVDLMLDPERTRLLSLAVFSIPLTGTARMSGLKGSRGAVSYVDEPAAAILFPLGCREISPQSCKLTGGRHDLSSLN